MDGSRAEVVWRVARDPQLLRIQSSYVAFAFAEQAAWLAILVYAYERGGVGEAGVVAVVQLVPAIVLAPFAAYAGDRFRPERVLALGYVAQSLSMIATAAAMWADRPLTVYAAGAVVATCVTFTRPVMGAILPIVSNTPNDLVAANVVTGLAEYVGMFVGPLAAALLLLEGTPALVFAVCAGVVGAGALLSSRLRLVRDHLPEPLEIDAGGVIAEMFGGLRALREYGTLRILVVIVGLGALTCGVNDVLMVTFSEARLGYGGGAAGLLGAGFGVGAVFGAVAAAGLIGRSRLLPYLVASALLTAISYFALVGIDALVPAVVTFVAFGMGEGLLRITTGVGIQRGAPDRVLARIFGVSEGLQMALMASGSLLVSVLVSQLGLDAALAILGTCTGIGLLLGTARFGQLGGDLPPPPEHIVTRVLADPVLAHLRGPAVARLADRIEIVTAQPGDVVITEGESGDRYYLVVAGRLAVTIGGEVVGEILAGGSFGEIALLRDVPRMATVTCVTAVELYAISRDDFLTAVTGHPRSLATATQIADDLAPR